MKTNEYVKLSEARKALSREWGFIPLSSDRKALNAGLIPHRKSGQGKRSNVFLKISDLRKYYETLIKGVKL